jgi:AICAR transformylase/IMP cyclohydrolase PurH
MASDAFFPFPDCVELAKEAGTAVIQPGFHKDELGINATKIKLQWYLQELVILNINLFNFARHNFIT